MDVAKRRLPSKDEKLEAYGRFPLLTFALAVVLPVAAVFAACAVLIYVQMDAVARDMDRHEDLRTTVAVRGAFDSYLNALVESVSDEGTWDEAYLNVVVNTDSGWMDTTWGASARLAQSYDTVLVTDQVGNVVFGEGADGALHGSIDQLYPSAPVMLQQLSHAIDATGDASTIGNYAEDKGGLLALAAISIHKTGDAPSIATDKRRILWLGAHVSQEVLREFAERYQIPLAHLTQSPGSLESAILVQDANNQPITRIAWISERPGAEAQARAATNVNIAMGVIGAVAALALLIVGVLTVRKSSSVEQRFTQVVEVAEEKTAEMTRVLEKEAKAAAAAPTGLDNRAEGVFANNFEVVYAPIFDLREERLVGAEALMRWKGRDGAPLHQEDLTFHELNTLLQRLGVLGVRRVLEEAVKVPDLPFTIAVPSQILTNGLFVEKLGGTLAVTHFAAQRLRLAVDMSVAPPLKLMQPQIDDLKLRNIGLMLDQYVLSPATIPFVAAGIVDRVRLARDIVVNLDSDAACAALAEATMGHAVSLGLTVAAGHVARREVAARLLRLGCREFQGNLIAEPVSIGHLVQLSLIPPKRKAG